METMIDISSLWFAPHLIGNNPTDWLNNLSATVEAVLQQEPERSTPTVFDDGAKIVGPVVFGKNCVVGHGALVVGPAVFGDNCVIGHCSEVARSIFGNGSRAAHFNYVGDSVLGSDVNLGAGAKLANLRFDKKSVRGLEKLGAIIGDKSLIGCNAVVDPGVQIASGVWFAGAHLPFSEDAYTRETIQKYFYLR